MVREHALTLHGNRCFKFLLFQTRFCYLPLRTFSQDTEKIFKDRCYITAVIHWNLQAFYSTRLPDQFRRHNKCACSVREWVYRRCVLYVVHARAHDWLSLATIPSSLSLNTTTTAIRRLPNTGTLALYHNLICECLRI